VTRPRVHRRCQTVVLSETGQQLELRRVAVRDWQALSISNFLGTRMECGEPNHAYVPTLFCSRTTLPLSPIQPRGLTEGSRAVARRTATPGCLGIPLILSLYPERGYRSPRTLTMPTSRMPDSAVMWLEREDR
jgi:hypothetical protein